MSNPAGRTSDDDLFLLLIVGMLSLGAIGGLLTTMWSRALAWLLEHQVVVPALQHPLVALPGSAGAGLDLPRLALAAAAALLLLAALVGAIRRQLAIWAAERELQ